MEDPLGSEFDAVFGLAELEALPTLDEKVGSDVDATLDRCDGDESLVGVRPLGAGGEIQLLATPQRHRVDTVFRQAKSGRYGFGHHRGGRRSGRQLARAVGLGDIV